MTEKTYTWTAYEHKVPGFARHKAIKFSIELTEKQFLKLWEKFRAWKGSQKDFYFNYVNRAQLREVLK